MDWTVRGRYGHWSQPSRPKATPAKATAAKVAAKATAATAKAAMPPEPPPAKATAATAKAAMEPPEPPPAPSPKQVAGKAAMEPPPEPSPKRVAGKAGGKKRAGGGSNRGPAQDARERQRFRDEHDKNVRLVEQVRQLEFALQQSQGSEWSAEITAELLQGQAAKLTNQLLEAQQKRQQAEERGKCLLKDSGTLFGKVTSLTAEVDNLQKRLSEKDKIKADTVQQLKAEHRQQLKESQEETKKALDRIEALKKDFECYKALTTKELRHERSEKAGDWVLISSGVYVIPVAVSEDSVA